MPVSNTPFNNNNIINLSLVRWKGLEIVQLGNVFYPQILFAGYCTFINN